MIADSGNHRIQRCTASICDTVAGTSGVEGSGPTELNWPYDVALDAEENYLIADWGNNRIQRCSSVSPGSPCQTVAGTGFGGSGPTELSWPRGVAWVPRRTTSTTATTSSIQSTSFATATSQSTEAAAIALVSRGRQSSGAGCVGVCGCGRALPRLIVPCVHGSSTSSTGPPHRTKSPHGLPTLLNAVRVVINWPKMTGRTTG